MSSWSWGQLVSFLQSGYPLDVRQQVFEWVLIEYIGVSTDMGTILQSESLMTLFSFNYFRDVIVSIYLSICGICLKMSTNTSVWESGFRGRLESWYDSIERICLVHRPSEFVYLVLMCWLVMSSEKLMPSCLFTPFDKSFKAS